MVDFEKLRLRRPNEELLAIIGAWAKEHLPTQYAATLQQVSRPAVFRSYLLRLIEIRADGDEALKIPRDTAFLGTLPVSVIDETKIKRTWRVKSSGDEYVIAGDKYEGSRHFTWSMLETPPEDMALLQSAIKTLDLEVVP